MPELTPEPPELTPEQVRARIQRIEAKEAEWKQIQSFLGRLASIGGRIESGALLGLLDLYDFHDGDLAESFGHNWLGKFVFELLESISIEGISAVANHPEQVRRDLDYAITNIQSDVLLSRKTLDRYAGILERMDAVKE